MSPPPQKRQKTTSPPQSQSQSPSSAMAMASNGGLLYHEVQESKLCAVHCVNTVLQGPFFSELDLAALASDLDMRERQMLQDDLSLAGGDDFLAEDSHNVSVGGDFSIQVLQKALEVWDLQVIPLDSPDAAASKYDPELESAFICHLHDHWFCIRKVNGEWYNFNSLYAAPEHLSKFYLSAYLDTLVGSGWSIFLVRGNFPKECPPLSEASITFGQWLTPDDAKRITKTCNQGQLVPAPQADSFNRDMMAEIHAQEEEDLNAAIAASLMDSSGFGTSTSTIQDEAAKVAREVGASGAGAAGDAEKASIGATDAEVSETADDKDGPDSASVASEASTMSRHDKTD